MKRYSFFLALATMLVLSFGLAYGQNSLIYVSNANTGYAGADSIPTNNAVVWTIALRNSSGGALLGSNNGFRVHSPSGASWTAIGLDTLDIAPSSGAGWKTRYDGTVGIFSSTHGSGADTVGIGGFNISGPGFENGFDFDVITITMPLPGIDASFAGGTLCLDSAFYDVNEWLWSTTVGGVRPDWSGPHCYDIFTIPNLPPLIDDCPTSISGSHCDLATFTFAATDQDANGASPPTFVQLSGPAGSSIDASTGVWSYAPTLADVGASLSISVAAQDDPGNLGTACVVPLNFTNEAPVFTAGCTVVPIPVGKGNPISIDFDADAVDCDPITFVDNGVTPTPVGSYSLDPNTGVLTFNSDVADGGITYTFSVCVTDGAATVCCDAEIIVLEVEPYQVEIEKTHRTIQGGHELVDVSVTKGSEAIKGFDILIAYDNSALSFVAAYEGDIYSRCGWEYFTYRFGAQGNCGNGCPSGLLKVVGLAETNNGGNHPSCFLPEPLPTTLFTLDFLVTSDLTFECMYVPIRFFWLDCTDNSIAFNPSDDPTGQVSRQAISRAVIDFDQIGDISNPNAGYPTFQGAQDADCFGGDPNKPQPIRFIDYINGGIDIVCVDSIDARGDVNLNSVANEVADAVLFTNYFIYGIGVFTVNVAGQVAATDVNADGLSLSVADLVYLIRIVVGDATPYPKLVPVEAVYTVDAKGTLNVDVAVGAASIELQGNVEPILLAGNMKLEYHYDAANNVTRTLVYSMDMGHSFTGEFLNTTGADVVSIEMATYEGAPISAKEVELPTTFALDQNYPNPFNPSTNISFSLPTASDYTLTIYNVTGQKVAVFSGSAEAGVQTRTWEANDYASGVYFYKLVAGNFTDTKKMVLLR